MTYDPGGVNLRFLPGNQPFYVTATEPVVTGSSNGSSAVATTNTVTFG
jgi:hypothetical protein